MLEKRIEEIIKSKDMINSGDMVIAGLSGGPDSLCMFDVLMALSKKMDFSLAAVHVNHRFRPIEAEKDQKFVEKFSEERGVPCKSFVFQCEKIAAERGISSEEAGRFARYTAFYDAARSYMEQDGFKGEQIKIALAHNANDQAETLMMRIIRGTGTDGLAGIEYIREGELNTRIIRPILDIYREEIEEYCNAKNLNPRIDHTNSQPIYTRNKIRLELLPKIKEEYNGNIAESLNRLGKAAKEDKEFFDAQVDDFMEDAATVIQNGKVTGISVGLEPLRNLHRAVRKRIIRRAFDMIGLEQGISAVHIEGAEAIIRGDKTSAVREFPKGYCVAVSYGEVRFFKNDEETLGHISREDLKKKVKISIVPNMGEIREMSKNGSKRYAAFDLEKIVEKWGDNALEDLLKIRTRSRGDWIRPLGMKGRKKLQDIFVDEKVYRECRDKVPVVAVYDEILWIIGDDTSGFSTGLKRGRVSENYRLTESTRNIVLLEFVAE